MALHNGPNSSSRRLTTRSQVARVPRVNYDGSARRENQARDEASFGSTATENISRAQCSSGIQEAVANIVGATPEGRAWALAALHPCGAGEVVARNVGALNGMCDTMTSAVATPVYRSENHLSYRPSVFAEQISMPTTYGIDIVVPPVPEIDFMYRLIDDSTNQKSDWIVVRLPDFELPPVKLTTSGAQYYDTDSDFTTMSSVGYGKIRQIAIGHTFELDAGGLNNQGRVIVGQMEGQWRNFQLTAPHIDVKTGTFVTSVDPTATGTAVTEVINAGADSSTNVWILEVPTDPSAVVSNCPNAYQGLAKHGAYVVQKFTSPLLGYAFKRTGSAETYQGRDLMGSIADATVNSIIPYFPNTALAIDTSEGSHVHLANADSFHASKDSDNSAFGTALLPIIEGATASESYMRSAKLHPGVSEPSDMMTATIMFRNLPAGGTSGITSSVRVKSRNYYEAISNGTNAAVAPYIHPPAQFDFQALNSVIIAGKQLSDGYPASANALSDILNKVWGALKQYVQPVAKTLGGLNIPFASGFSNLLDKGIDQGRKWEKQLDGKGFGSTLF